MILAIDPSLTSAGYSLRDHGNTLLTSHFSSALKGIPRLADIRKEFIKLINEHKPTIIFIEGYAYGSGLGGSRNIDMGELGGMLRLLFFDYQIKYIEVSPQHIKKYVTGKGNANKEAVIAGCEKRFGIKFKNNDECDAYCLGRFGEEICTMGVEPFLKKYDLELKKAVYNI